MLHIAICDDDYSAVVTHKEILENCLMQSGNAGKTTAYTSSENLLYDITEDHFFFDLILLDIEMPGITGMEIAKTIKPYLPNIKIIFITSHIEYAIDAFELSIFRYVPKPHPGGNGFHYGLRLFFSESACQNESVHRSFL